MSAGLGPGLILRTGRVAAAAASLALASAAASAPGEPGGRAAAARPQPRMVIQRAGQLPSGKGEATTFTGDVRRDGSFRSIPPGRIVGGTNTFEPGARTFWHSHPLGQSLVVLSGVGLTQVEGEAPVLIRPGDVITVAPGVRHWHGATPTTAMVHLAVAEANAAGEAVAWGEAVSQDSYLAADRAARAAEAAP